MSTFNGSDALNNYLASNDSYSDFLAHHGIKGQKWGVRNGPPYPLGESSDKSDFASDSAISSFMKNNFTYSEFTTLKSHDQVLKDKSGSCHDQVMYEAEELRKLGYKPKAKFLIEYDPKTGQGGMTHSFVYYKKDGKQHYFENAWGGHEGIKTFSSEKDIDDYFRKSHRSGEFGDPSKYTGFEITDFKLDRHKPGESLQELVDIALDDSYT